MLEPFSDVSWPQQCLDWSWLRKIYPIPVIDIFPHSQLSNPSPSDLDPILLGHKQANPSSHFTPSGHSKWIFRDDIRSLMFYFSFPDI